MLSALLFATLTAHQLSRIQLESRQPGRWPESQRDLLYDATPIDAAQRQLILAATIRVVGTQGYRDTSVADIVAAAGVSGAGFHRHFDDKGDCFVAAYEAVVERIFAELATRVEARQPWIERATAGLAAIVELFAADPALARIAVVEVAAAGAEARRLHWETIGRLAELLEPGRELAASDELPANTALMAAGSVAGLISDELLAGRGAELRDRLPELTFALLVPYVGTEVAAEEMHRVAADQRGT